LIPVCRLSIKNVEKADLRLSRDTDQRRSLDMSHQQLTLSRMMLVPRLDYLKFLVVMTHLVGSRCQVTQAESPPNQSADAENGRSRI
jgi:hypothetical protein